MITRRRLFGLIVGIASVPFAVALTQKSNGVKITEQIAELQGADYDVMVKSLNRMKSAILPHGGVRFIDENTGIDIEGFGSLPGDVSRRQARKRSGPSIRLGLGASAHEGRQV